MKPGPSPTCQCGKCRTCETREARRRYYVADIIRRGEILRKNAEAKRARKRRNPEVSDAEMDRRALILMGRQPNARL